MRGLPWGELHTSAAQLEVSQPPWRNTPPLPCCPESVREAAVAGLAARPAWELEISERREHQIASCLSGRNRYKEVSFPKTALGPNVILCEDEWCPTAHSASSLCWHIHWMCYHSFYLINIFCPCKEILLSWLLHLCLVCSIEKGEAHFPPLVETTVTGLKGNTTNFTHDSMFTGPRAYMKNVVWSL